MSKRLPKRIFVYEMDGGNEKWLQPEKTLLACADLEEKRMVGVYELVETLEVSAEVAFKPLPTNKESK